jgi:hypothetical protein
MARIPPIKRLSLEDFKDQIDWIGRLIQPINDFMSSVAFALNKQITWTDNMNGQVVNLDVTINGTNDYPIYFKINSATIKALWVGNCYEVASSPTVNTNAVYIAWELTGSGQVKINNISGLTTGKKYRLIILTLYS